MKREEPADIKLLHKKYKFFDKPNIKILYEFCDEDYQKTEKVLVMSKEVKNPKSIIKLLLEKPERGQALISTLEKRYDDQAKLKLLTEKKEGNQTQQTQQLNLHFFKYIPEDACLLIYLYLDPYSAVHFSSTSRKMRRVYNSQAFSEYYKRLCINLFEKFSPVLPQPTRFLPIKSYVLKNANLLGPNAQHAVIHNLRKYVWGQQMTLTKQPTSYYQSFGGYKQLFLNAPRINFNGFYFWKQEYRKQQEKDLLKNVGNVHIIKYYRYLRFFADGSVISVVLPSKQKEEALLPLLSGSNLEKLVTEEQKFKQVMVGEYIAQKDKVEVKVTKSGSIFSYSLQIIPDKKVKLLLLSYKLKVIDNNEIVQTLIEANPEKPIFFNYFPSTAISLENQGFIRSSSL